MLELANNMTSQKRYHLGLVLSNDFAMDGATHTIYLSSKLVARVDTYKELLGKRDGMFILFLIFDLVVTDSQVDIRRVKEEGNAAAYSREEEGDLEV
jgi:hypothetical protein